MAAFVIFDQTSGAVQGICQITAPAQLESLMTLNQKPGTSTMAITFEQLSQIVANPNAPVTSGSSAGSGSTTQTTETAGTAGTAGLGAAEAGATQAGTGSSSPGPSVWTVKDGVLQAVVKQK